VSCGFKVVLPTRKLPSPKLPKVPDIPLPSPSLEVEGVDLPSVKCKIKLPSKKLPKLPEVPLPSPSVDVDGVDLPSVKCKIKVPSPKLPKVPEVPSVSIPHCPFDDEVK
jgi:hypothetical protein